MFCPFACEEVFDIADPQFESCESQCRVSCLQTYQDCRSLCKVMSRTVSPQEP